MSDINNVIKGDDYNNLAWVRYEKEWCQMAIVWFNFKLGKALVDWNGQPEVVNIADVSFAKDPPV